MGTRPNRTLSASGALMLLSAPCILLVTAAGAPPATAGGPEASVASTQATQSAALVDGVAGSAMPADTAPAPATPRFLTLPLDQLTPMQRAIRLRVEQEQAELERLTTAYRSAASDEDARALQQRIHEVKRAAEVDVLQIQLSYARAEGRAGDIAALEQALATFERNGILRQPADRAAPDGAQQ